MTQNYLLGDAVTRIRNAYAIQAKSTQLIHSKTTDKVISLLIKEGYLKEKFLLQDKHKKFIDVRLKYFGNKKTKVISEIKLVSKPGLRVYAGYKQLPIFKNNLGITIISTPIGIITHKTAIANKVGGEVLCQIF